MAKAAASALHGCSLDSSVQYYIVAITEHLQSAREFSWLRISVGHSFMLKVLSSAWRNTLALSREVPPSPVHRENQSDRM